MKLKFMSAKGGSASGGRKFVFLLIFLLILPLNLQAADLTYDLGISSSDISFSEELVAGQQIRIYAAIHNYGHADVAGYVTFYQGDILIGDSQVVSVRSGGLADEVYVDWQVPKGSFNIRAEIKGQDPRDENASNDIAITSLFVPLPDNDGDGIPDRDDEDDDNDGVKDQNEHVLGTDPLDSDTDDDGCLDGEDDFPLNPDECFDTDADGIGDNADTDNDNDGLSDSQEEQLGTDPLNQDSDNDNVIDSQDDYPLDPARTEKPVPTLYENENINVSEEGEEVEEVKEEEGEEIGEFIYIDETGTKITVRLLIKSKQIAWNTYEFRPELRGLMDDNLVYQWDFGDGYNSNQKIARHKYAQSGQYKVALKVSGKEDMVLFSNKTINISFFNTDNILVWVLFGGLLILLMLLLLAVLKRNHKRKK